MVLRRSESLEAVYGPLQEITITYATPNEVNMNATPVTLGTTAPGTETWQYTIQSSDLPIVAGAGTDYVNYGYVLTSGRNTTASTMTLHARVEKNGVTVVSDTTAFSSTTGYWTYALTGVGPVVAGDVIKCYHYASIAGGDWRYRAVTAHPSRLLGAEPNRTTYFDLAINLIRHPTLASLTGLSAAYSTQSPTLGRVYRDSYSLAADTMTLGGFATVDGDLATTTSITPVSPYGIFRHAMDNGPSNGALSDPTRFPYFSPTLVPTSIKFRRLTRP